MVMKKRSTRKSTRKTAATKKKPAKRTATKKGGRKKAATKRGGARKTTRKVGAKKKVSRGRKAAGGRKAAKKPRKTAKKRGTRKKKVRRLSSKKKPSKKVARSTKVGRATSKRSRKVTESGEEFEIKSFLTQNNVKFDVIKHSPAYTAQQVAASSHVSGRDFAKPVMVKVDGVLAMVVEPAHKKVDLEALKNEIGATHIEIAREVDFRSKFPRCELGAMPPFGNCYGMDVYISESLSQENEIAFNAGSHSETLRMTYEDFNRLVKPKVIHS